MWRHPIALAIACLAPADSAGAQIDANRVPEPQAPELQGLGPAADRFAGAPIAIDTRLRGRTCASPQGFTLGWADPSGRAVEARCDATGERLVLPLAAQAAGPERVRRGENVQAEAQGPGFRLSVGAVAESTGRDGRVILRNSRSGQRFAARMDPLGRIIVSPNTD